MSAEDKPVPYPEDAIHDTSDHRDYERLTTYGEVNRFNCLR